MNPRVKTVTPTDDYKLLLTFTNREHGIYDCSPLLGFGVFQELREEGYFQQVTVVDGTVSWPHDQNICPDTLYLDARREKVAAVSRVGMSLESLFSLPTGCLQGWPSSIGLNG